MPVDNSVAENADLETATTCPHGKPMPWARGRYCRACKDPAKLESAKAEAAAARTSRLKRGTARAARLTAKSKKSVDQQKADAARVSKGTVKKADEQLRATLNGSDRPVFPPDPETHARRLRERGVECCPWCDGRGQRWQSRSERVPCAPCDGSGEADRWQGPAAENWRSRKLAAATRSESES